MIHQRHTEPDPMSETKHTPGNWTLEFPDKWPYGFTISSGDVVILHQDAMACSFEQKTREDCLNGVGFKGRS